MLWGKQKLNTPPNTNLVVIMFTEVKCHCGVWLHAHCSVQGQKPFRGIQKAIHLKLYMALHCFFPSETALLWAFHHIFLHTGPPRGYFIVFSTIGAPKETCIYLACVLFIWTWRHQGLQPEETLLFSLLLSLSLILWTFRDTSQSAGCESCNCWHVS